MKRYLLDTGPAQQFLNKKDPVFRTVLEKRQQGAKIGICTPVLGELWAGIEGSQSPSHNRTLLVRGLSSLILWPFDSQAAQMYGKIFEQLKKIGRPMQQIDMQLASIALSLGECTVVSMDSDLLAIPGLVVENWAIEGEIDSPEGTVP